MVLAGVVGVTLALALAVTAGAVPQLGEDATVRTAAVSQVQEVAAPSVRQPGDVVAVVTQATTPTTVAPAAPTTAPKVTAPPTTAPVAGAVATTRPAATVATVAPARTAPAPAAVAAAKVARRTPTGAEAQAAITEMKRRVGGLVALVGITELQLAQAGDQVCTAFDNGQTFAQVKATGLSMIPAVITVTPPTVDWAVRQGVAMYCPGHASKLV